MTRSKRIVAVDLDNTLTADKDIPNFPKLTQEELAQYYRGVKPNNDMIELVRKLSVLGNEILIFTSRHDYFALETAEWLIQHEVPYDRIIYGKPFYHMFIDDKAVNPYCLVMEECCDEYLNRYIE